jgi:hypothetical protein
MNVRTEECLFSATAPFRSTKFLHHSVIVADAASVRADAGSVGYGHLIA